jgi:hypothetical protein
MNENIDQLRETFAAHEYLTPNPTEVLKKAGLRARSYQRRRLAARATGVSVLGAGIVAGGVRLPDLLRSQHGSTGGVTVGQTAAGLSAPTAGVANAPIAIPTAVPSSTPSAIASATPIASPSAPASPAAYNEQQELNAYFGDGYDYNNAMALATLWHETDIEKVKADAGLKLLQGATLPVTPNGTPETPQEKAQDAFFAAGYGYDDAVTLAGLWHETDLTQVKAEAGQKLLDGESLPIAVPSPSPTPVASTPTAPEVSTAQEQELAAYFAAGYDYNDAIQLGTLWHQSDLLQIKTDAGQKLLAGQALPIPPVGATPASS